MQGVNKGFDMQVIATCILRAGTSDLHASQAAGGRESATGGPERTISLPRTISEDPAGFEDPSPKSVITHQVRKGSRPQLDTSVTYCDFATIAVVQNLRH